MINEIGNAEKLKELLKQLSKNKKITQNEFKEKIDGLLSLCNEIDYAFYEETDQRLYNVIHNLSKNLKEIQSSE